MKLRLTGGGFEKLTGQFGLYEFENGLSVSDIPPNEAYRLACSVGAVWEDGSPANISELHNMHYHSSVDDLPQPPTQQNEQGEINEESQETSDEQSSEETNEEVSEPEIDEEVKETSAWTREKLEKIADEKGIKGLREIANEYGVKANSINALIDELLALNP